MIEAIERGDKGLFLKLNGHDVNDLNFEINSEGVFPLLIACAKGE